MRALAFLAPLFAGVMVPGTAQFDKFICVEWPGHPHGYDVPIYYWNSAHKAYIWHGADCSMFPNGEALNCDSSRIMGTAGNDVTAYNAIQGLTDLDNRMRLAFFKSCRITVNTLEKDEEAWIFRQNGAMQASAGKCAETNVGDCSGKFASGIQITVGTEACLSSERGARDYRAYFASIEDKLVDGVNPVLHMPAKFKAMVDGGIQCDSVDKLPRFDTDETGIYGVMSWNNSNAMQLIEQVEPKPECLVTFPASAVDSLMVGSNTDRTCTENFTARRLKGGEAAHSAMVLASSDLAASDSSRFGLASWVIVALVLA